MKIVSVGEVLWDILLGAEHLGGAPFNFAWHAHNLGHEVCFVSAVGNDPHGQQALEQMDQAGLSTRFIRRVPDHPTGTVTVAMDPLGLPHYTIHRPAAYDFPALDPSDLDTLLHPAPDWIYFGTLQQMSTTAHDLTLRLLATTPTAKRFYDINLRTGSYTPGLVRTLAQHADVLKLNEEEIPTLRQIGAIQGDSREQFCRNCLSAFQLDAICITLGPDGCALLMNDEFLESPGFPVQVADTIGTGDAFSAALLHGINAGRAASKIAGFANRVGALIASRPGGTPKWSVEEANALQFIAGSGGGSV